MFIFLHANRWILEIIDYHVIVTLAVLMYCGMDRIAVELILCGYN